MTSGASWLEDPADAPQFPVTGKLEIYSESAPDDTGAQTLRPISNPRIEVLRSGQPCAVHRRPIRPTYQGSEWTTWQVLDQRFVDHRPDVLSFETDVLDRDVVIAGDIVADIFASTSGTDSDWIVKLIDVYPEGKVTPPKLGEEKAKDAPLDMRGYQLMVVGDVMRGRFRNSFSRPEPVPAGKVVEYKISLHSNAHTFLKGHKIMVQIQSTWFPLIDRNPQKYVDNIFLAKEADHVKATQRISRSRSAPSAILLPVLSAL